ncbi:nif-specific transcriptional activator NifA [Pseudomonas sp. MAP12]|uniref:Nif-specific regulatory protein n=1 Tax=Geopseudomonas aromaticivorans TaxID=2849492 RepID=A0ABS6MY25_9GAMM|nr:nif-specific transcriptional activator NifA [Pseudomonas aromaticivorans]MBV2133127.1 nif-specific transcriptional activator NifA [Pseudomonas aromaticivorans]
MNVTLAKTAPPSRTELYDHQLQALARISRTLSRVQQIEEILAQILAVLHNDLGLEHGLVSIGDPQHDALQIGAVHTDSQAVVRACESVRYRIGEGVIGNIFKHGNSVVLGRIAGEPRFLDRLALYDLELPFIGVPIKSHEGNTIGVLVAQPQRRDELLPERARFMEIVANLLAQTVRLVVNLEDSREVADERDELRREVRGKYSFENMVVGHTPSMRRVFDQVRRVGKWDSTVLVLGESGTGKELIASAIHYNSPRAHQPFVRLNCAALPETLLESELFGHEKGAFTGAVKQRKGRFEQADGGTLFLDEIGEISPMFQAKLLRVLQEGEFERVGGNQTVRVNVRIVAATNRDLESEVDKGKFREDLYYRLNVMAIRIPALRERSADIPELAEFLLAKIGRQQGRKLSITDSAIRLLMSHRWPGNVRELENCLERSAIMSEDGSIGRDAVSLSGLDHDSLPLAPLPEIDLADGELDDRERVVAALEQAGWVQAKAARLLGMTPRQIAYRIQTLNIHMRKI